MVDVVVVGGGPGGSVTALLLARAGIHVELLERHEFPRAKPCGDCVSPGANAMLRALGVWDEVLAARPAQLTGWQITGHDVSFAAGFPQPEIGLAISRQQFDDVLLRAARDAGARVRTRVRLSNLTTDAHGAVNGVVADTDDGALRLGARIVVGADGLRSRVARVLNAYRRAPRLRKVSLTAHVRGVADIEHVGEMHVVPDACLGIAPVTAGAQPLCNVTLVMPSQAYRHGNVHEAMRAGLRRFANRNLAHLITDDVTLLASGPFDWPTRQIVFDGAALVGDAAGYYDPFTGQGIYQALAGAHLLADAIRNALDQGALSARALAPYADQHQAMMRPARRVQALVERTCASPLLARTLFGGLARAPACATRLTAVTGDMLPPRALFSPAFLTKLTAASIQSLVGNRWWHDHN